MRYLERCSRDVPRKKPTLMKSTSKMLLAGLLLCGCARGLGDGAPASLVGLTLPLLPSPSVRLSVAGAVGEQFAEIEFDVSAAITLFSSGCVESPTFTGGHVKLTDPLSGRADEAFDVVKLDGVRVGSVQLKPLEAAMINAKRCVVVLGLDVLSPLAFTVRASTREVSFMPSRSKKEWLEVRDKEPFAMVLEVTREPKHDWPLLPVRIHQGPSTMTATFMLSTADRFSRVFAGSARKQGLRPGVEVLRQLMQGQPLESRWIPVELEAYSGFPYERFELAPGFGTGSGTLDVIEGDAPQSTMGTISADVWGRFEMTYDVQAGFLRLSQPGLHREGARFTCDAPGVEASETNCFELHSRKTDDGLSTVTSLWRPLEKGARLYFDTTGPVTPPCRIGVTFSEGSSGRSTQHLFPWQRLSQVMPECAEALNQATGVTFGLFEEGPMPECSGVCGFIQDLRSGRVSCECQPRSGGTGSDLELKFFELYRKWLSVDSTVPDIEPADPE